MKFVTDKEPKQPVETDQEVIFTYDVLFQVRRQGRGSGTRVVTYLELATCGMSLMQLLCLLRNECCVPA